ncbi:protein Mis18-alpha-like [Dendropsophus ebraccatus]|uniref:protein Mis18-alpha-like n=1 Tax=Dendropsophus ebraccatus TaxID=150705 RepID=UPI0038321373
MAHSSSSSSSSSLLPQGDISSSGLQMGVYQCGNCRMPVGDTTGWPPCHEEDKVVVPLKAVTQFVDIGKPMMSTDPYDAGSQYQVLSCSSCHKVLGKYYSATPPHLSHKCNLYYIDSASIEKYEFGKNLWQSIHPSEAAITVEIYPHFEKQIMEQRESLEKLRAHFSELKEHPESKRREKIYQNLLNVLQQLSFFRGRTSLGSVMDSSQG